MTYKPSASASAKFVDVEFHPGVHPISKKAEGEEKSLKPGVKEWGSHEKAAWEIGSPLRIFSKNFVGLGLAYTRKDDLNSAKVLDHYPESKRTIVRIAGVFQHKVYVRDLWLAGIFQGELLLPPKIVLVAGRFAATFKSHHLVLEPDNTRVPHTSTPLFPLVDSLAVYNLEGRTLEEMFQEVVDLEHGPLKENWVQTCNFTLPVAHQKLDPSGHNYRKALNSRYNKILDWPLISFNPGQFVVMEFVNDSVCLVDRKVSWKWFSKEWNVPLQHFTKEIPFAAFEFGAEHFRKTGRGEWQCARHKKVSPYPSGLDCCFPPLPPKRPSESHTFLWFMSLYENKKGKSLV